MTKVQDKRDALAKWWDRNPWPCLIMSCDPGKHSGVTLIRCGPGGIQVLFCRAVDTYSSQVEGAVDEAIDAGIRLGLPVVVILEDWGKGGPMGIQQWIGLGEQRGAWRRAVILSGIKTSHIKLVTQSRWRSRVLDRTGVIEGGQPWRRFTPGEWKQEAHTTARDAMLDGYIPNSPDASESACMAYYGARSDEVGDALGVRYLKQNGYTFEPLERAITG